MTVEQLLHVAKLVNAEAGAGSPHSVAYRSGVFARFAWRVYRFRIECRFDAGTVEYDAFLAGYRGIRAA